MKRPLNIEFGLTLTLFIALLPAFLPAQMITGTWKGKINRQKVELKIIQNGDSLVGTSYYYESLNNYRRYSIKGYFDQATNEAVWWDDQLLVEKTARFSLSSPGKIPMLSTADFNCPGGSKMMLDGKAARKDDERDTKGDVHLDKTSRSDFEDEWDFVIENYTLGASDPRIIDSIGAVALVPIPAETSTKDPDNENTVVLIVPPPPKPTEKPKPKTEPVKEKPEPVATPPAEPARAPGIEEKFTKREKVFIKEIPVSGDSIELRFYDNAEIDGDSISLFLNDKLLFQHIRLTANPYIIKLPASELKDTNELVMVAENLGSIPPNTSYMVAIVKGERYDAYLASNEGSSAMIRLVKQKPYP